MRADAILPDEGKFRITDAGVDALQTADDCDCSYLTVIDGVMMCTLCDTVYGIVYGYNKLPHTRGVRRRQRLY